MILDPSAYHMRNAVPVLNRVSPFAHPGALFNKHEAGGYADTSFGYSWNYDVAEGDAVYGLTENFPPGPLENLGTGTFIRVPYRRVPRIRIESYSDLLRFSKSIVSQANDFTTVWRGQAGEYALQRELTEKLKLYGDINVCEPSLLPSAIRAGVQFESYTAAWFGLLELFVDMRIRELAAAQTPATVENLKEEASHWYRTYQFKLWAFAIAQHYGLPSTGLDLTNRIEVALFFALHRFKLDANRRAQYIRANAKDRPIIYVMGVHKNDLLPDAELAPSWLQASRPKAQSAFFFGTAWGNSSNRAAERIFAVLELHAHETWTIPDHYKALFPPLSDDLLCSFCLDARTRYPKLAPFVPLERIYWM